MFNASGKKLFLEILHASGKKLFLEILLSFLEMFNASEKNYF